MGKSEYTGQKFEIVWDVAESILEDIPDWAHARRAVHQLLTLITDAIAYGGEPAFSTMVRRGLVEAVVAFMETHTRGDILSVMRGLVASGTEGPWEVEAEERLFNAIDLAEGLWERAAEKYGLHECGNVEVRKTDVDTRMLRAISSEYWNFLRICQRPRLKPLLKPSCRPKPTPALSSWTISRIDACWTSVHGSRIGAWPWAGLRKTPVASRCL